jgi:hypothetical protein
LMGAHGEKLEAIWLACWNAAASESRVKGVAAESSLECGGLPPLYGGCSLLHVGGRTD